MARTTDQPSTATRRNTATAPLDTNGPARSTSRTSGARDGQLGDNAERRENLTAVRDEQDNDRNDSRDEPASPATTPRTNAARTVNRRRPRVRREP